VARQVLKPRTRYVPDPGPFEGVPEHLILPLLRWLASALRLGSPIQSNDAMYTIMNRLRIAPKPVTNVRNPLWETIMQWIDEDHARLIAVIEVVLDICMIAYPQIRMLEQILDDGASIYTATENGIEERVDPVAKQAAVAAMQPNDHASAELSEAWTRRTVASRMPLMLGTMRSRPSRHFSSLSCFQIPGPDA
jgi:hypothetical protein